MQISGGIEHGAWGMEHEACGETSEKSEKGEKGKKKKMQNHLSSDLRPLISDFCQLSVVCCLLLDTPWFQCSLQVSIWGPTPKRAHLISPLTQPVHRIDMVGVSKILGPDELQSAELPLDHVGSQFVLIDFVAVGGETHRSEEGRQAGIL